MSQTQKYNLALTVTIVGLAVAATFAVNTKIAASEQRAYHEMAYTQFIAFVDKHTYQQDTNTSRINSHEAMLLTSMSERAKIIADASVNTVILNTIAGDVTVIKGDVKNHLLGH